VVSVDFVENNSYYATKDHLVEGADDAFTKLLPIEKREKSKDNKKSYILLLTMVTLLVINEPSTHCCGRRWC
jgi:hypothetical protein